MAIHPNSISHPDTGKAAKAAAGVPEPDLQALGIDDSKMSPRDMTQRANELAALAAALRLRGAATMNALHSHKVTPTQDPADKAFVESRKTVWTGSHWQDVI